MEIHPGDVLEMKKNHPCGGSLFTVLRAGMDLKLRCQSCGREVMVPRHKAEKSIRQIKSSQGLEQEGLNERR